MACLAGRWWGLGAGLVVVGPGVAFGLVLAGFVAVVGRVGPRLAWWGEIRARKSMFGCGAGFAGCRVSFRDSALWVASDSADAVASQDVGGGAGVFGADDGDDAGDVVA
jgi:hypothetical protein